MNAAPPAGPTGSTPKGARSLGDQARTDRPSPRLFWIGMAVLLMIIVFLGFGSTYGRQLAMGLEIGADGPYDGGLVATDWIIHLHAAVFVGWMAFFLVQTIFAARGRMSAHMNYGGYGGLVLGVAVVVVGSLITYKQIQGAVSEGLVAWSWTPILLGSMESWLSLLLFAGLLGLGLLYRSRPEAHKRLMVFATVMLTTAAFGRTEYLLGDQADIIWTALVVAPLLAYDLYTERRVHPATLVGIGAAGLKLGAEFL